MTTDKRAAAIAALIVRDVAEIPDRCSPDDQPEMMLVTSDELTHIVMRRLAALEADDGRALRDTALSITGAIGGTRREDWDDTVPVPTGKLFRLRDLLAAPEQPAPSMVFGTPHGGGKSEVLRRMTDKSQWHSLAPEQPAPEPISKEAWFAAARNTAHAIDLVVRYDGETHRFCADWLKTWNPAPEPAAPHADDEARIAEWRRDIAAAVGNVVLAECARARKDSPAAKEAVDDAWRHVFKHYDAATATLRSLAAGKAKAEAELAAVDAAIADRGVPERDCSLPLPERVSNIISELKNWRHEAGTAQVEVERLRGRDAEPFDWDAAPSVQEWIDENLPEREPRAGSKMVELHPDEVIADRGESRRVAGWLKDLMAENAKLRAERDAAVAAQNTRAEELLRRLREGALETATLIEGVGGDFARGSEDAWRAAVGRIDALRAEKPAAEPVPDAADAMIPPFEGDPKDCAFKAREGDEALRSHMEALQQQDDIWMTTHATRLAVIALLERALAKEPKP